MKILKKQIVVNTKLLLLISLVAISIVYYIFLPFNKIVNIILNEYIIIVITLILIVIYQYFKLKLKGKLLHEFIPNTNHVEIQSTLIFFIVFQIIDFYYEDGFIGMISQWFLYWIFGLLAYFLTHNINFYKNYLQYSKSKS